jgi:misacylated tRNA(Ala) deacylase
MILSDSLLLGIHPSTNPQPFVSEIIEVQDDRLRLAKTKFYATGGGQPSDHGIISCDDYSVDVEEVIGKNKIYHITGQHEFVIGMNIVGSIDQDRRNSLAKMHTAQHLFSALADDIWSATTVGNQIGTERTRIDLRFEDKSIFDSMELENSVNENIQNNLNVSMEMVNREILENDELLRINLDRMPANEKDLRVIEIAGLDKCPCAGTHVQNTSELDSVEITKVKSKGKGKLRIEYRFQ